MPRPEEAVDEMKVSRNWKTSVDLAQKAGLRIGLWDWNLADNTIVWSDEIYRQWGCTRKTFSGRVEDAVARVHPRDRSGVEEAIRRVLEGAPEFAANFRVVRPDQTVCWIEARGEVVHEGSIRVIGIGIDITAQKKAEPGFKSARMEPAPMIRTGVVGQLDAAIAHEISQPLTSVLASGWASQRWLAMQPPRLDEVREAVAQIVREADRACKVIAGVRNLLSKKPFQLVPVDINQTILDVLAVGAGEFASRGVNVHTEFATDLPAIPGDPVQLHQVMFNLVTNGVEAMSTTRDRPRDLSIRSTIDPLGVLIQVRDSGTGVESGLAQKIFEPFFTTKPHNLGVGLSISRSIVEAHGGSLWAEANGSHGAVFQFILPKARDSK